MKKQLFSLLLIAAVLAAAVISCGRPRNDRKADTPFVGFTLPSIGNDFMLALSEQIRASVEEAGAQIQMDAADGDVTTQIEQIENYITMGADLIVVFPISGEAVANACRQAMEQGIPVVAFAVEVPCEVTSTVVNINDREMGRACADMVNAWLEKTFPEAEDGEVHVLVLGSSMTPQIVERTEGMKTIAENPKVTMKYFETENQDSVDACRKSVENAFMEYPGYDVVMCVTGTSAIAAEAFVSSQQSGILNPERFGIFSIDETEEITRKIEDLDCTLRGTISMGSIEDSAKELMQVIAPILKGEEPVKRIDGTVTPITEETS